MVPDISSVLTRVRGIKSKIFLLIEEAEAIRANLTDVCEVMSESIISTRLPSAAVTGNNSPALTTTGYDLNSPAASTIYLGNRYRSARSRLSLSGTTSPELEKLLPTILSSVHRRALQAMDRYGPEIIKWKRGFTALHWAYKEGRPDIVDYLIRRGARTDLRDENGLLPSEYMPTPRKGIAAYVDLESIPPAQQRALRGMESYGWKSLKWAGGFTILHWAYQAGRQDVIKYCESQGMPQSILDDKGFCPKDYAK